MPSLMLSFVLSRAGGRGNPSTEIFYHKASGTYKTARKKTAKKLKKDLTDISRRDIYYIELRYIEVKYMDNRIERVYVPMTETGFYILYCLQTPQHGYGIARQVEWMTNGELAIGAGTMYGTLSKMEKDGLIVFDREEEKRRLYRITELGEEVLDREIRRIERLYLNSRGEKYDG